MFCPQCGTAVPHDGRFCPSCGRPLREEATVVRPERAVIAAGRPAEAETVLASPAGSAQPASGGWLSSSASIDHGRFAPGAILDGRYRVIGLLGRGGMGEVYRADDLRLGQPVALKFLPEVVGRDPVRLAQFHNEVRTARQVSHPNICRVYDIGEVGGHLYLSMEYVDGEDLASSLRRIGRFPEDRATEIARQLCAGLAAAHERGVLHRDLKPANVMLDARGKVRLMDFGLAAAGAVEDVRAGTPAYMAPEQLLGREVTARSDIFALGLVLYELFTGRRAFAASTVADLVAQHQTGSVTAPSTIVSAIDPAIEHAILRCLEPDPARRPSTALAVSAALPGGDPLAAALAAGETPSPEMVAAAGEGVGLSPRLAATVFLAVLTGIVAVFVMFLQTSGLERLRPEYSAEVLAQRARDALGRIGYAARPRDEAHGFEWSMATIEYLQGRDTTAPRWEEVLSQRPSPLLFWYRQSPYPMTGLEFHHDLLTPGIVRPDDPAPIISGMIAVRLDHHGWLKSFEAIPPQLEEPATETTPVDWSPLFELAGLERMHVQPAEPLWNWLAASDTRAAWTGVWPGSGLPLRVEAAALRGRPVAFMLIGPWTKPWRMPAPSGSGETLVVIVICALAVVVLGGAGLLARSNLRRGRGDRHGAVRLAAFTTTVLLGLWICQVHLVASLGLFAMFLIAICTSVFYGVLLWTMYIALEPFVRRYWPQTLVSWSALLTGRAREPIVGRDVLFGAALGVFWVLLLRGIELAASGAAFMPYPGAIETLDGFRSTAGVLLMRAPYAIRNAMFFFFLLFLFRVLLRSQWAAAALFAGLFLVLGVGHDGDIGVGALKSFLYAATAAFAVLRWGLLSLTVAMFTSELLFNVPATLDVSAWYFGNTLLLVAVVVVLTSWAFYTSVGGRAWRADLFA